MIRHGALGRLEDVDERAAVAASALVARDEMLKRGPTEAREMRDERREPSLLLLQREAEVAQADLVRLRHLPLRPDARVLARVDGHAHAAAEVDRLAAGDGDHPIERHARRLHDADLLVAADETGVRVPHVALGAPHVIEVRMLNDDPPQASTASAVRLAPAAPGTRSM